jgi:hypothetical protein
MVEQLYHCTYTCVRRKEKDKKTLDQHPSTYWQTLEIETGSSLCGSFLLKLVNRGFIYILFIEYLCMQTSVTSIWDSLFAHGYGNRWHLTLMRELRRPTLHGSPALWDKPAGQCFSKFQDTILDSHHMKWMYLAQIPVSLWCENLDAPPYMAVLPCETSSTGLCFLKFQDTNLESVTYEVNVLSTDPCVTLIRELRRLTVHDSSALWD